MVLTQEPQMTSKILQEIESVCPDCLARIPGQLIERDTTVFLEKTCPLHGMTSTVVWRGSPSFSSWARPKTPYFGGPRQVAGKGCPYDCGLCENHTQRTCTALVEITSRCNLNCPVCFADSGTAENDLDHETLSRMFATIMKQTGGCNLQLSGGEPTVRDDLPQIVTLAKNAGFEFIQLNTNGLALADDPTLAQRLADAGLSSVFLQFDGMDDEVLTVLRGRKIFAKKIKAIENISATNIGIVLVPTLVQDVNTHQLWDIVRFGLDHQPHVRGVHFQPMSYFGRFPKDFIPNHVTLPEVMSGLAQQSDGVLDISDFRPPGCEHSLCSFSAKYLMQHDGTLQRLGSQKCDCKPAPTPAEQGALTSIAVTARQWGKVEENPATSGTTDDLEQFLQRARTHTFSISGMAFQDCWSMNLERVQGCCIHIAQPDGRLIPFCSFNLTSRTGKSLHRPQMVQLETVLSDD